MVHQAKAENTSDTKQVRDAEATKAIILAAAEEEFAQHGLTAARTEAIASKTGVAKSMIYYYFKHKSGLYQAVLERSHAELLETNQQLDLEKLAPEAALEQFLVALLNCVSRNPNLPTIMFHEAVQNQGKYYKQGSSVTIDTKLIAILERGVATGVFRPLDLCKQRLILWGLVCFILLGRGTSTMLHAVSVRLVRQC